MVETALLCLALNVYHESRGEPIDGQKAVAQVTMNRAGNDVERVCDVVFRPYQFEWTGPILKAKTKAEKIRAANKLMPDIESLAWDRAKWIAARALNGRLKDVVGDADHFLNPKTVKTPPKFAKVYDKVADIGNHTFYRSGN